MASDTVATSHSNTSTATTAADRINKGAEEIQIRRAAQRLFQFDKGHR